MNRIDHPLKSYLAEVNEPVQAFAERVGASRQTLYRVMNNDHPPSPPLAARIVEATGGAVTFNMLYGDTAQNGADIVTLPSRDDAASLDYKRMTMAMTIVIDHLTPKNVSVEEDIVHIAVEASINTYAALSTVTTRQGPDRLAQALRPVLEEILQELKAPLSPSALERGADLAAQLYLQAPQPAQAES